MIFSIRDKLPINKLFLFSSQLMMAVFTASVLIANICNVDTGAALVGAGIATIVYAIITGFNSPMIISNSGAFVAPALLALSSCGYSGVAIGGVVTATIYVIFGIIFSKIDVDNLYKFMPKVLIGSITVVIGINLMGFIPNYIGAGWQNLVVAFITIITIALVSHYCKGALSLFPFLIGTLVGYIVSIALGLVDFSIFKGISLFKAPQFAFLNWSNDIGNIFPIIVVYIAFTISAICECLSDHAALGGIVGVDLYRTPGINRIFIGEGVANLATSFIGGLGGCSYGEGVATVGFSKCASIYATIGAAILMILLGFIYPIQAFISSIPPAVIGGGTAAVLYGFISASGIKLLKEVDLNNQKNLILCSTILSMGISGVVIGNDTFNLTGTALALVVGIALNLLLKEKKDYA